MRRFVAYLSLALASVATIGATFNSTFTQTDSNIEYANGHEMVFRLSPTEDKDDVVPEGASLEIAKKMEERLNIYGETQYDVVTVGDDTVKVVLSEKNTDHYEHVSKYLTFNGSFALGTETNVIAVGDEFMDVTKDCYVTFINHYPTVVIPVNKDGEKFKAVIEEAKKLQEETPEPEPNPETGETPAKAETYVHLVYNYIPDVDTITDFIEGHEDYDDKKENKILLSFNIGSIYLDDSETAIAASVNIADENGQTSFDKIGDGTYEANFMVNLLNADKLNYNIEKIDEHIVNAYFETVVSEGDVTWSRTLTATIFAILILSLLLAVFYRWGAVAIATLSVASTYCALLLAILFTVEFNTAMVIGLCAVALASIGSGIVYMTKVKEEAYRGRTLKKANAEGAKRALLPIVDINVALILIGACVYWLGGAMMASFASVAVFGGIISLILNTLGLKGLMWLLTNTTKFQGKYNVIGVENSKVPNILNEESQTYYGPYQDSNPTKNKKVIGILAGVLFVASLVGGVTFGCLNNGVIFNDNGLNQENSYLYIETTTETSEFNLSNVETLLQYAEYVEPDENGAVAEGAWENASKLDFEIRDFSYKNIEDETTWYVVLTLDGSLDGKEVVRTFATEDDLKAGTNPTFTGTLEKIISDYNLAGSEEKDSKMTVSFKNAVKVNAQQPNYAMIIAGTAVGVAFMALYLMLRYGLSRGLVSLIVTTLAGFITVGIFALTRASVGLNLFIALPVVMFVTMVLSIIFINKEKEMVRDDKVKSKDDSNEHREELMIRSSALALGPILVFTAMAVYLMVNFFGFGVAGASSIFMFGLVGTLLAAVIVAILYGPTSHAIFKLLRKMNIRKPDMKKPHKKNKKKVVKAKSAEPEEAIFIGIND